MRIAAGLVALLAALALAPAAACSRADRDRASTAYRALERGFRVGPGLYREDAGGELSTVWPLSQALAAAIALGDRRQVATLLSALDRYWDGRAYRSKILPPWGPGGDVYYDDNEWIALDLLDAYALLPQPWLRERAARLFGLVSSGWSRDLAAACPGGVYWGEASDDRNAVSTENAALLALRLHELTGQRSYLHWAETMDGWVQRCLRRPDGLVADHIRPDGSVDDRAWSYNQGAAIAVGTRLWRATGERGYLERARETARAALDSDLGADPPAFVAIFFRDLATLEPVREPMRAYAASVWSRLRPGGGSLLDHAALVDLYARLS